MLKQALTYNESVQPNTDFLATLKNNFPVFFDKDGEFDIEKFKQELKQNNVNEAKTGHSLGFVGKDWAKLKYGLATTTVIEPDVEHNSKPENRDSENVFITGDNLEVLKHLQNAYSNQIKMIYIDPPYNTGKEFVYNDKFEFDDEKLKGALGYSSEEIFRLKSLQGKSSHSAWLAFMYPRLKVAQKLLKDDGVIFISIDDNEQANLKLLCDEIFGEGNFIAIINWKGRGGRQDSKYYAAVHEYILCYARDKNNFVAGEQIKSGDVYPKYDKAKKCYYKTQLLRKWGSNSRREDRPNLFYSIAGPDGSDIYPMLSDKNGEYLEGCWRWGVDKMKQALMDERIEFIKNSNGNWIPYEKIYAPLNDQEKTQKYTTWIEEANDGADVIKNLFSYAVFDYPKNPDLILKFFKMANVETSDIILDFFAGSGTTAQAVLELNKEDGGNRKFIMVQLDEPTKEDSEARKAGYNTIDQISRERIKRAGGHFKHFICKEPPKETIDKIEKFDPSKTFQPDLFDNMVNDFGEKTILQTWLIADGYKFNQIPETKDFKGYKAHYIDGTLYIINKGWEKEQNEELLNLAGKNELRLNHIRIYGYSPSMESLRELKINVQQSLNNVEIEIRY